jgi:hypothetical protein
MAHAKDKHYWTQLRAALTAGQWSSPSPAKAPNGSPLSWFHVIRKFNKHCKGFQEVAEVASQTQALCMWLGANTTNVDQLGVECDDDILLLDECILPPERIGEGKGGYEILKGLDSKNFDVRPLSVFGVGAENCHVVSSACTCVLRVRPGPALRVSLLLV